MAQADSIEPELGKRAGHSRDAGWQDVSLWEDDRRLLTLLSSLQRIPPQNILRKASWAAGESLDPAAFQAGRPLPAATRKRLQEALDRQLRIERETIEACRQESAKILHLLPYVLGLAALLFVFL
jgi:hypothetical protein